MRSKTPLAMMEQALMLLVFALAAALCLRAFVWSDTRSVRNAARDQAMVQAGNAAELLKHSRGDFAALTDRLGGRWDGGRWTLYYDENWKAAEAEAAAYFLTAAPEESGQPLLGQAAVTVGEIPVVVPVDKTAGAGAAAEETLVSLTVCWQEVD